jgi:hypothetical protein
VSFLIADFSGQSLIRLSHMAHADRDGASSRKSSEAVPLVGTPHGRALAEQRIQLDDEDAGTRLFAPVTSRGEAVGVLELRLEERPDERALAAVADARTRWPTSCSPTGGSPTSTSGDSARCRCRWRRRSNADCCPAPTACSSATRPASTSLRSCRRRVSHPREAVQELTRAVVAASGGELRDDATVLCLDWHGGPPRDRDASAGAGR